AALAHATEHEQWPIVRPRHHDIAGHFRCADQTKPSAPCGRLVARVRSRQIASHGMRKTRLRYDRFERLREYVTGWLGWQHGGKRRAVNAELVREFRPRGNQQCATVLHIARDVLEIGERNERQPARGAATIEDHEIETVELLDEQFARGK